jgi:hypothetical protein
MASDTEGGDLREIVLMEGESIRIEFTTRN